MCKRHRSGCLSVCCLGGPLRGHARSHRIFTILEICDVRVGAGLPAKRPVQVYACFTSRIGLPFTGASPAT
ncbi:hypothetical protein DM807_03190 [Pseudomonas hunanensis]|nr:hypothetical protein [Pseudomonas hunanensis]RNF67180.1 hypothetical protein EFJ98_23710 [Pseudomonas putida]